MAPALPRGPVVVLSLTFADGMVSSVAVYGTDPQPVEALRHQPAFLVDPRHRWAYPTAPVQLEARVAMGAEAEATRWLAGLLGQGWRPLSRDRRR